MFGYRTPAKKDAQTSSQDPTLSPKTAEGTEPSKQNVRRSIGEWEAGKTESQATTAKQRTPPPTRSPQKAATTSTIMRKAEQKAVPTHESKGATRRASVETAGASGLNQEQGKPIDRVQTGRVWLQKAKCQLSESRNLKTDLKAGITLALDHLYRLLKEEAAAGATATAAAVTAAPQGQVENPSKGEGTKVDWSQVQSIAVEQKIAKEEITEMLKVQGNQIEKATKEIEKLRETVSNLQEVTMEKDRSYASVVAAPPKRLMPERTALHSIVVAAKDNTETGEEVMDRIRKAVNAKDGWITVEKVRKAKNQKVIMGCKTREERERVKERLKEAGDHLLVEEVENRDPMLVLRDVLACNSDMDITTALRNQNGSVFHGLKKEEDRMEIKFRRKARNPLTSHVVVKVSPQIYNRMMGQQSVHIDLQKVRVEDQSPLVQCSMCLGYGHGRRYCRETEPKCSHCGGPHMKDKCPDWLAGAAPSCCNCVTAKLDTVNHGAFSTECPVRRKWDALARAKVAYC